MTSTPVYRITTGPRPPRAAANRYGTWRGLKAATVLLLTAADELISAMAGTRPIAYMWRTIATPVRAAYRLAAWPPPEAEIIPHITEEGKH
jgi:hypothetical protein